MGDHVIDGRNFLPATDYLELVWRTIGIMKGTMYSIHFQRCKFYSCYSFIEKCCKIEDCNSERDLWNDQL